jgi:hypothetical protein
VRQNAWEARHRRRGHRENGACAAAPRGASKVTRAHVTILVMTHLPKVVPHVVLRDAGVHAVVLLQHHLWFSRMVG